MKEKNKNDGSQIKRSWMMRDRDQANAEIRNKRIEEIEKTSHISRNLPITDLRQPT